MTQPREFPMLLRSGLPIIITAFWLAMMSTLFYREYFTIQAPVAAYEILPLHSEHFRKEYRGVYLGETPIGFNWAVLEKLTEDGSNAAGGAAYELRHNLYMTFRILGHEREMQIKGRADLNGRLELMGFDLTVRSGAYWTKISGQSEKGNLHLVIEGKDQEPIRQKTPLSGPIYFSEALHFLWTPENLIPGKQGRLKIWNPLMMTTEDVSFRVGERTTLRHDATEQEVIIVYLDNDSMITRNWITPEGVVLKQESPTGLTLVEEEAWRIFDKLRENRNAPPDLPNLFSVPAGQRIENPEALTMLTAKLTGPGFKRKLTIRRAEVESPGNLPWPVATGNETLASLTQATEFIQSDHAEIRRLSREIIGRETSAWQASLKLMAWVHDYVAPSPTVSIPSAVQVLSIKKGDCNEYTVLFTALARALGIPTKMMAGLVYRNERFFYHAWPEVYVGKWVGVDPTFNQAPVDVTHIALVQGSLKEQVSLAGKIGQLNIVILETA